ncbi:MAG: hypothetical protein IK055_06285 [Lachnospiraceae bacterium]|nr:hypothetical protein [Lachnospiraceae bacterium]
MKRNVSRKFWLRIGIVAAIAAFLVASVFIARGIRNRNRIRELRESHPQYFDLSNYGLTVYVWRGYDGNERCMVFSGPATEVDHMTLSNESKNGVSLEDMKLILSTYDIPESNITVRTYTNSFSSTMSFEDRGDEYIRKIRRKLL